MRTSAAEVATPLEYVWALDCTGCSNLKKNSVRTYVEKLVSEIILCMPTIIVG